jgi:hypothetical protein
MVRKLKPAFCVDIVSLGYAVKTVFRIRILFLRILICKSGGQLITGPAGSDPSLTFLWPLKKMCCQIGTGTVVNYDFFSF